MLCVCVLCVFLCVLILIFRRAPLSIPTCVNTPADQMADNDFQIDTLHSTSRENQWALIAFFPRRSSLPEGYYLSHSLFYLSQFLCLLLQAPFIHFSIPLRLNQFMLLFTGDFLWKDTAEYLFKSIKSPLLRLCHSSSLICLSEGGHACLTYFS